MVLRMSECNGTVTALITFINIGDKNNISKSKKEYQKYTCKFPPKLAKTKKTLLETGCSFMLPAAVATIFAKRLLGHDEGAPAHLAPTAYTNTKMPPIPANT